jgi:hypothetical protein
MADSVEELSSEIGEHYSFPPELVTAVGAVLMEFAHLEVTLNHLIWGLLRLSTDDGKNLTARLDARPKLEILAAIARRYLRSPRKVQVIREHSKRLQEIAMYRNACAHGMWYVRADGRLYCSSYRWEVEDGFVGTKAISVRQLIDVAGEIADIDHALMKIELGLPHKLGSSLKRRRVLRPILVKRPESGAKQRRPYRPPRG